jgi:hypothetical protein
MSEPVAVSNTVSPSRASAEFHGPPVSLEDTGRIIGRLQQDLQQLLVEQTALLKRIRSVRHTLAGLADIFGSEILSEELKRLLSKHTNTPRQRERTK